VYAKSVLTFNQAAEEHVKTFGSKKSELLKSNADVIDCAQYGGCNDNADGAGGVGVNVDNTNTMLGHRKAVAGTQTALEQASNGLAAATAKSEAATRALVAAQSAHQSAQSALNQANNVGRKCYSVTVGSTCSGGNCHHNKHQRVSVNVNFPAVDLSCPSRVDKSNWLTGDQYKDVFEVQSYQHHAHVTRVDEGGPWGMTMVMRCCDQNIEKAQAALNVASGILQESQRRAAEANSDLAAVRSRIDAAQKAHDTAKAAQANQKY
jgi:hypothetical protein